MDYPRFFGSFVLLLLTINIGYSIFRIFQLQDPEVAHETGGYVTAKALEAESLEVRQALNIVEELAISCEIKPPRLYIDSTNGSINALGVGGPAHSFIVLTQGSLGQLDRDETQALVAGVMGPIAYEDHMFDAIIEGALAGPKLVFYLCFCGTALLLTIGSGALSLLMVPLLIPSLGALTAARWTKALVTRSRRLLADHAAIQFTRNPGPLIRVLEKSSGYSLEPEAGPARHLYFAEIVTGNIDVWIPQLPTVQKRIDHLKSMFPNTF